MNGIADLHHPLMQALGFAVLHSVWQGILLFCILKIILSFVPERNSVSRYRIVYVALAGLFSCFLYTFLSEWQYAATLQQHATNTYRLPKQAPGTPVSWQYDLFVHYTTAFSRYTPVLAILYTLGLLVLCFKMIRELLQVKYLRREIMLPENLLLQQFDVLKEQAAIRRNVLLRLSERVQVPVMLGHLKPVILLPLSLLSRLDSQQLEAILLHELAHIKRHDYFWNILQMVMETLLFFNPVAWWLSATIRVEREHCCDDYVLWHTQKTLPYAHALLTLEECRLSGYRVALAASGNKKSLLLNRIKRITEMKQTKGSSQKILATVTILVLLAAMACFATAFGQDKKDKSGQKTITKSYSKKIITVTDDEGNTRTFKDENCDHASIGEAMKAIPRAMELAGNAMDVVDWSEISKTTEAAMVHANRAIKQVNQDEIQANVAKAMKEINWDEIQATVSNAMQEARASIKEIDWDQINEEMAGAQDEVQQAREEIKEATGNEVRQALREAKRSIKEAMKEVKKESRKAAKEMRKSIQDAEETEASSTE